MSGSGAEGFDLMLETWTPFVVPFLDLLWILVRFMVRTPQKELQMGVQECH